MIDERYRHLAKVDYERFSKGIRRILESGEFEPIEPNATAVLADVGIHTTEPKVSEWQLAAWTVERDRVHGLD